METTAIVLEGVGSHRPPLSCSARIHRHHAHTLSYTQMRLSLNEFVRSSHSSEVAVVKPAREARASPNHQLHTFLAWRRCIDVLQQHILRVVDAHVVQLWFADGV